MSPCTCRLIRSTRSWRPKAEYCFRLRSTCRSMSHGTPLETLPSLSRSSTSLSRAGEPSRSTVSTCRTWSCRARCRCPDWASPGGPPRKSTTSPGSSSPATGSAMAAGSPMARWEARGSPPRLSPGGSRRRRRAAWQAFRRMSAVTTALGPKDATFEEHRSLLFGVAYRMLGSVAEAEDVVQDAYLRYRGADGEIANPRAYLVTIVTRLCLDLLKSARVQREQYIGPWLPEPIVRRDGAPATPEEVVASEDNISMAFLVMLEELGPAERAVFLLREVFDYDYGDIAPMLNKSEAACRQVFRRAREHVAQRQHRFTANYEQRRVLTAQFLQAANEGNMAGLMQLLSADVTAYSDGGGKAVAATRPIFGPDRIARFVIGVARKDPPALVEMADVNGVPGVLLRDRRGRVHTVMVLELDAEGRIATVYSMRNPDKLRRIA